MHAVTLVGFFPLALISATPFTSDLLQILTPDKFIITAVTTEFIFGQEKPQGTRVQETFLSLT